MCLAIFKQIYVKQQRDLQFLHVSLENSQELRQKHEKVAYERRYRNLFFLFYMYMYYFTLQETSLLSHNWHSEIDVCCVKMALLDLTTDIQCSCQIAVLHCQDTMSISHRMKHYMEVRKFLIFFKNWSILVVRLLIWPAIPHLKNKVQFAFRLGNWCTP